jgi:hypothetical protein
VGVITNPLGDPVAPLRGGVAPRFLVGIIEPRQSLDRTLHSTITLGNPQNTGLLASPSFLIGVSHDGRKQRLHSDRNRLSFGERQIRCSAGRTSDHRYPHRHRARLPQFSLLKPKRHGFDRSRRHTPGQFDLFGRALRRAVTVRCTLRGYISSLTTHEACAMQLSPAQLFEGR